MQIADPERWLEDLRTQVTDVRAKSTAMIENMIATAATVTSKDGAVTVTISPTGALQNIELKQRAAGMSPGKLTASIMEAVRAGQRSASAQVVESFAPLGAGTESMALLLTYLPDADEDEQQEDPEADFARPEEEAPPSLGASSQAQPQQALPQSQPAPTPATPTPPLATPRHTAKPARSQPADDVDPDNNPW